MATTTVGNVALNEDMSAGLRLQVSKVIRAKRERTFAAWTKPELMQSWFGSEQRVVSHVSADVRVGGEYRIEMTLKSAVEGQVNQSDVAIMSGVYKEIVPNELLRFTWNGTWNPGEESLVTVALKDVEGGTEVTVTHERFATMQSMNGHEQGWLYALAKFDRVIGE